MDTLLDSLRDFAPPTLTPTRAPVASAGSEKRAAVRRHFSAKGWIQINGRKVELKTFDASSMGVGVIHHDLLPSMSRGPFAIGVITPQGIPAIIQAEAEVRHTVLAGGAYRSGLLFTAISPENARLLSRIIEHRLTMVD